MLLRSSEVRLLFIDLYTTLLNAVSCCCSSPPTSLPHVCAHSNYINTIYFYGFNLCDWRINTLSTGGGVPCQFSDSPFDPLYCLVVESLIIHKFRTSDCPRVTSTEFPKQSRHHLLECIQSPVQY